MNEEIKKETIKITDANGLEREAEVLTYFKLKENNKNYIIYTFNEPAGDELVTVHASCVVSKENGDFDLMGIDDENEWNKVKEVMRDIIKSSKE